MHGTSVSISLCWRIPRNKNIIYLDNYFSKGEKKYNQFNFSKGGGEQYIIYATVVQDISWVLPTRNTVYE